MQAKFFALGLLVFASLSASTLSMEGDGAVDSENIRLRLFVISHSDQIRLNVTFSNILSKFTFLEINLLCLQNNNQSMERAKRVPFARVNQKKGFGKDSTTYKLVVQKEGYVQCSYNPWGKTLAASNLVFIRFGNIHVSVAKLNQNVTVKWLQSTIGVEDFRVRQLAADKTVFHLTSKYVSKEPVSDRFILLKAKKLLEEKLASPIAVEYVRSTKYCPSIKQFEIPYTGYGINYRLDQNAKINCQGNFYEGAHWNEEQLKKLEENILIRPHNILKLQNSSFSNISGIQSFAENLQHLEFIREKELPIIADKFDLLVMDEKGILKGTQKSQNTSNELLANLDSVLVNTSLVEDFAQEVRENFAARVEDIRKTGSAGILLMDNKTNEDSNETSQALIPLSLESNLNSVIRSSPSVGIRLPNSLLEDWNTPQRLVVTVFKDAQALFDEKQLTSSVVSASLGGIHQKDLKDPVIVWFRRNVENTPEPGICVFWDFKGKHGNGRWSREGCFLNTTHRLTDSIYLDECHCNHLTHFGELLWNSEYPFHDDLLSEQDKDTLGLISFIGCIVSLVSLCVVLLTAIINRKWLKGPGQKMLLQMSIALALLMIMFLVGAYSEPDQTGCFFVGFVLHYAILANFCWMLVAGYLQYHRLVRVIYTRTPKLILKAAIVGWGVPVIPGALVLISGQFKLYSGRPMCLPRGWAFHATILAPLCIILICNLFTFMMIYRNLYTMVEPRRHADRCISIRRFKQLAFLFTLLGLNWVFGVCQILFPETRVFFAYLFSFTVAFQGLAYLIFFVLMHDKARDSWRTLLCGGKMLFKVDWSSSAKDSNQTNTESDTQNN